MKLNFIKRSLAVKISLNIGILMIALLIGMGVYLTRMQSQEHLDTMDSFLYKKASLASMLGAKAYGTFLEEAVNSGALTVGEVFDKNYQAIEGYDWGKVPKYHTKYDTMTDNGVLLLEDKFLLDPDFVFAVGVDSNGYLPTHNTKYQKAITGDPAKDLVGNRSKRIFDDTVGLGAARNTKDGYRQVYKRDTGETLWDVSTPIMVKGQHWGAFRIGVQMAEVEARSAAMTRQLVLFFAVLIVVVVSVMFFLLRRNMIPVRELATAAEQMSSGEALDKAIVTDREDEIGMLSGSLERLRISMKAAVDRFEQ